jgi:hypothetical protein
MKDKKSMMNTPKTRKRKRKKKKMEFVNVKKNQHKSSYKNVIFDINVSR